MIRLDTDCEWYRLSSHRRIIDFDCGNQDLNEFFNVDALLYSNQLLGVTYFFATKETNEIVCAYTVSNDSLKTGDLPNARKKKIREDIPREKHIRSFPATLIGRFGVSTKFREHGIGSQLMEVIKTSCLLEEGDRCRFLLVDAYNDPLVLRFYERNDFRMLFGSEEQEKGYFSIPENQPLKTRFMYFDLLLRANQT